MSGQGALEVSFELGPWTCRNSSEINLLDFAWNQLALYEQFKFALNYNIDSNKSKQASKARTQTWACYRKYIARIGLWVANTHTHTRTRVDSQHALTQIKLTHTIEWQDARASKTQIQIHTQMQWHSRQHKNARTRTHEHRSTQANKAPLACSLCRTWTSFKRHIATFASLWFPLGQLPHLTYKTSKRQQWLSRPQNPRTKVTWVKYRPNKQPSNNNNNSHNLSVRFGFKQNSTTTL